MTNQVEDHGIYDEASAQRWNARCGVWVERSSECIRRIDEAKADAAAKVKIEEDAFDVLEEEMEKADLSPEDIEHVLMLSVQFGRTLTYTELEAA